MGRLFLAIYYHSYSVSAFLALSDRAGCPNRLGLFTGPVSDLSGSFRNDLFKNLVLFGLVQLALVVADDLVPREVLKIKPKHRFVKFSDGER